MHWPQLYKHISRLHQMSLNLYCVRFVPFCFQCFFAWKPWGGLCLFTKPGKFRVAGGNFCNYWATRSGFEANKFASICRDLFFWNLCNCHVSWHRLSTCCCVFGCLWDRVFAYIGSPSGQKRVGWTADFRQQHLTAKGFPTKSRLSWYCPSSASVLWVEVTKLD